MKIGNQITSADLEQLEKKAALEEISIDKIEARKQEINKYLSNLSEENADRLIEMFSKNNKEGRMYFDEVNYINTWIKIFAKEREYNVEYTIFTGRESIEEVMKIWRKAYFLLWRMEYEKEEKIDTKKQFWSFLQEQKFSIVALQYLLLTKSAYLDKTTVWLAKEFLKEKSYNNSNTLLSFIERCAEKRKDIKCALNSYQV